ncbi:MAG: hypothetical protein QM785_18790 [Pyrinomonadaceae bacterium]
MNVIDDLYLKHPTSPTDDGRGLSAREPEHPFEQDDTDHHQYPYPKTFHPNILPPTEFMALGMYAV